MLRYRVVKKVINHAKLDACTQSSFGGTKLHECTFVRNGRNLLHIYMTYLNTIVRVKSFWAREEQFKMSSILWFSHTKIFQMVACMVANISNGSKRWYKMEIYGIRRRNTEGVQLKMS